MKKIKLLSNVMFMAAIALLAGCAADLHQEAKVSIEVASGRYKGKSPVDLEFEPGQNIGYLLSEPVFTGVDAAGGHAALYKNDPQIQLLAGGPSDDNREAVSNYTYMQKPAVPANYFSISEELEFVGKGFKSDAGSGGSETDHLYYLELPVLANYNMKMNSGNMLHFGLGPYAATGLFGHYSANFAGQTSSGSLKFGSNADFQQMDYGLVLNAGYNITSKIDLTINYDMGLKNINSTDDKIYNNTFGLNVGYRFK